MRNFIQSFFKYSNLFYRVLLFAVSIAVIVYFLPREGKFKYEFQQGSPWMHVDLIAPFNFPIYKSKTDLEAERDSIKQNAKPYFRTDNSIYIQERKRLEKRLDEIWNKYISANTSSSNIGGRLKTDSVIELKKEFDKGLFKLFNEAYSVGIVQKTALLEDDFISGFVIGIINDDVTEDFEINELFTKDRANQFIINIINEQINNENLILPPGIDVLSEINIAEFLTPNLLFDKEITDKKKEIKLENLSLTFGMVQAGENIISKGDIVGSEKVIIMESLKSEYETSYGRYSNIYLILLAQFLLISFIFLVLYLFLNNFRKDIIENNNKILFLLLLIVLFVALAGLVMSIGRIDIYFVPFALLPIIIKTFFDVRLSIFVHIITISIVGFIAPNGFEFIIMQFIAGTIAVFALHHTNKRSHLFWTSFIVFITYAIVHFSFSTLHEGSLSFVNWRDYIWLGGNGLLILTSYPLIYIFERMFGFLSNLTLMELSDTNNPLLRKLSELAPGTFQHSMQVANLAEEAIFRIGGNTLLVRTGAMYHDIGKMKKPHYYIENLASANNPHDDISFEESADIIISHVKEGVKIAKKNNLPKEVIDFIQTHHGTSRVQYFYKSFIKKYPKEEADISRFTYPGPIPPSKETAVLMMADSVEAASRSLNRYTERTISDLVENIISYQRKEGLFDDADITFKELSIIKEIFTVKLKNIYHNRIKYPK